MEKFVVDDRWYGKPNTKYENITAKILHVTPHKVIVLFSQPVKGSRGRLFSKSKFRRCFTNSNQLNLFEYTQNQSPKK